MHNEFFHAASLFGFGFLGVLIMAFVKMNDLNKRSETTTFKSVLSEFIRREWPSYGLSLSIILTTALTHDEWLKIFKSGKIPGGDFFDVVGGYVKLSMVAWGAIGQYLIYKWLGKMNK